jgi:ParB-like chromosome segregation protein Spo0J
VKESEFDSVPAVDTPLGVLSVVDSPRTSGVDPVHVKALAAVWDLLPPIVVHRPTMRVIDGVHRLAAARLVGRDTIAVRFFDGELADAFVLAVRANTSHGMPLSLADRKRAAKRILLTHPHWSARRLVEAVGIAPGTVSELRRKVYGEPKAGETRIGSDGKARPVDATARRHVVRALIMENPTHSLRQIAREAGVSPETVRRLRNRMQSEDTTPAPDSDTSPALTGGTPGLLKGMKQEDEPVEVLKRLKADPALRYTATGRELLRLLNILVVSAEEWKNLIDTVPAHSLRTVEQLARVCAEFWSEFGTQFRA